MKLTDRCSESEEQPVAPYSDEVQRPCRRYGPSCPLGQQADTQVADQHCEAASPGLRSMLQTSRVRRSYMVPETPTSRDTVPTIPATVGGLILFAAAVTGGAERSTGAAAFMSHGPGIANHPVRVVLPDGMRVPPDWPLDARGAITCWTCHTAIPDSIAESGPQLRGDDTTLDRIDEFCASCHAKTAIRDTRSVHWLAVGAAHVMGRRTSDSSGYRVLDAGTRTCLTCHDGALASESGHLTPWNRSHGFTGDQGREHPIGVRYTDLTRAQNLSPLKPESLLPDAIILPDGKVGCVSCHNLYAQERYLLAVPIERSQLCFSCHDMN